MKVSLALVTAIVVAEHSPLFHENVSATASQPVCVAQAFDTCRLDTEIVLLSALETHWRCAPAAIGTAAVVEFEYVPTSITAVEVFAAIDDWPKLTAIEESDATKMPDANTFVLVCDAESAICTVNDTPAPAVVGVPV
jgi:hypothetical protein